MIKETQELSYIIGFYLKVFSLSYAAFENSLQSLTHCLRMSVQSIEEVGSVSFGRLYRCTLYSDHNMTVLCHSVYRCSLAITKCTVHLRCVTTSQCLSFFFCSPYFKSEYQRYGEQKDFLQV